ncbi:MAG: aminotransferase class III-fold pyridoxal phosphate-dependent enzyme [Acidobacteriota bacterium]
MPTIAYTLPDFPLERAVSAARDIFGLVATAFLLPGERDQNFALVTDSGERFVLKIANAADDDAVLDLQHQALRHLESRAPALGLPRVVPTLAGSLSGELTGPRGTRHIVRVLTWVPGEVLARSQPHTPGLLRDLGRLLGCVDRELATFSHPAAARDLKWDPRRVQWVPEYLPHVGDGRQRVIAERLYEWACGELDRLGPALPQSIIYNDANDYNVLVDGQDPYGPRSVSVIDFGDMVYTWTANDAAVACAYAMLDKPDPLAAAAAILGGYHEQRALADVEIESVFPLACLRMVVSVVNSAFQRHADPGHDYLTVSERPAWTFLERASSIHPRLAHYVLRDACGLEPCLATPAIVRWLRSPGARIGPLLDLGTSGGRSREHGAAGALVFDLSVSSTEAGTPVLWSDEAVFTRDLFWRIANAGASVGIGRYDEARAFYVSEIFRADGNDGPEWRTVHLGLDLFAKAGTPVLAPMDGVVHSLADNANRLDYGPTIILEHRTGEGLPFYTLYGHLARESLGAWRPGDVVARGCRVATIGDASVNGGWPPHLHIQVIADLLDRLGDFPGVARPGERGVWTGLCPDPNLVAQVPAPVRASQPAAAGEILAGRAVRLGPSLSVSYRKPLHIVRGWMQHLYDADGRAYLDAVNNVAHVGHCHPRIVEAGQRQMAVLNTNTRYLHELIVRYADRLCATLPEPLRVCFFVNSGSEANELALRMARTFTGSRETIVVDTGYHGNTGAVVEISPYKFDGPGGTGPAPHVHTVPMPDPYRGVYRGAGAEIGARYASHVAEAADRISREGRRVGAFIAESLLSCGGQIVLPEGYLAGAYEAVRRRGGVCIADEVQVGLGRVGSSFWAFETQGVVPDVVTIGKPIGNGHPLAAVITTPEIAMRFANGMEYFNTFGGNPVSCAIGMAVLGVIADEGLQARAARVGAYLLGRLRELKKRHAVIGDVRGLGLFVGIEFVRDRDTREPAGDEAGVAANRMRDRGVLVSTDGPRHNVIKIKPPLVFTERDADLLADTLDAVLGERYFAGG